MIKFIVKTIYISLFLGLIGYLIYMVGGAAFADAKKQAEGMLGEAGPMLAISILFVSMILTAMGGGTKK